MKKNKHETNTECVQPHHHSAVCLQSKKRLKLGYFTPNVANFNHKIANCIPKATNLSSTITSHSITSLLTEYNRATLLSKCELRADSYVVQLSLARLSIYPAIQRKRELLSESDCSLSLSLDGLKVFEAAVFEAACFLGSK